MFVVAGFCFSFGIVVFVEEEPGDLFCRLDDGVCNVTLEAISKGRFGVFAGVTGLET